MNGFTYRGKARHRIPAGFGRLRAGGSLGLLLFCLGARWLGAAVAPEERASLQAAQLRCEFAESPLGIDRPEPRLFWRIESRERGQRQTAYQVLGASSAERLASAQGDLWNSGKVASDETAHICYQGKALASSQRVFWKVRVWDQAGQTSAWSAPATWTMGLLRTNDWQAAWICGRGATEALLLRKEFDVRPGLVRAVAHVSGLGQYEMTINGVKAGEDLLSPGWTAYNQTVLYDTKEVTSLLRAGSNVIGLTLGNGMYNVVRRNRFVKFTGSFGPPKLIAQLNIEYSDGSTSRVVTDGTWKTASGPIVFSCIFGGEDYDARKEKERKSFGGKKIGCHHQGVCPEEAARAG